MEPQLQHPQVHRYGEDHHHQHLTNLEGEAPEEQHHSEKKSVLNKVKVKAKKIKESIKEHVHLHGHDQDQHDDEGHEHVNEAPKSHLGTDKVEGSKSFAREGEHKTESSQDHVGRHGLDTKGFTGAGVERLIIPEEAPVAPRNTPISKHGKNDQPISDVGDHEEETLTQPKQSSYTAKITSVLADKATKAKNTVASNLLGVQSMDWADKLKPGDEDRALSQLISGNLNNKKGTNHQDAMEGEEGKIPVKARVSDAVHKRASENNDDGQNDKEVNLMGKVTESEEVARRLGSSEEERRGEVTNVNPTGMEAPVREWIKETVSSWWSDGNQHPDSSKSGISHV